MPRPSRRPARLDLFQEALAVAERDAFEAGDVGYAPRLFVQLALPYRDPGDVPEWRRENGTMELVLEPGRSKDPGARIGRRGYPFGVIPRLLVVWMATEVHRTQEPELVLGHTLSEFLAKLELARGGGPAGSATRLRDQMTRLFLARVIVAGWEDYFDAADVVGVAEQYRLWWMHPDAADDPSWRSTVTLSDPFFRSILAGPIPVDIGALRAFRGSPLAIDIYQWLTYRSSHLRRPTKVPWEALALQFGGDYARVRAFKAQFLKQLQLVGAAYPTVNVEPTPAGLVLRPSPTHIRQRRPDALGPRTWAT